MTNNNEAAPTALPQALPFAGFWRRIAAFVIDALLLGLVGALIGWLAFDSLAALGNWGRLLGFALAWPYFGLLNSAVGGGRTVGKRLLGLRTLGLDGRPLSAARGLLRALVVSLPWFLNGAIADPELLRRLPLVMLLSLLIFGIGLGLLYLLVFNRPSRRSLHDGLAGSVVVRDGAVMVSPGALWRGHALVLALLALGTVALPAWFHAQAGEGDFAVLSAIQATVTTVPGTHQVGVSKGWTASTSAGKSTYFALQAWASTPIDGDALCDQLASAMLKRHAAELEQVDHLVVTMVYGYDIGIASGWQSRRLALTPAQWRERLNAAPSLPGT